MKSIILNLTLSIRWIKYRYRATINHYKDIGWPIYWITGEKSCNVHRLAKRKGISTLPKINLHCVKNNLNPRIKTEDITADEDATVYGIKHRNQTFTVAPAQSVTDSVFLRRLGLFLGQCFHSIPDSKGCLSKDLLSFFVAKPIYTVV